MIKIFITYQKLPILVELGSDQLEEPQYASYDPFFSLGEIYFTSVFFVAIWRKNTRKQNQ
jgi:hypothetical protein